MGMIKHESGWKFKTSRGQGGSIVNLALAKGDLFLTSPQGVLSIFHFSSIGAGWSFGADFNVNWSTTDMFSDGIVYVLEGCPGPELQRQDFLGYCMIVEVAGGASGNFGKGRAYDGLLLGIDSVLEDFVKLQLKFQGGIVGYVITDDDISQALNTGSYIGYAGSHPKKAGIPLSDLPISAKALLITESDNRGEQLTVGGSLYYGRVSAVPVSKSPRLPSPCRSEKHLLRHG